MPIYCAMGAVWPTRPGGSKMRPIENFWSRALLGLTVHIGANCDRRPPALRASNSRAFVFVTSARPCSLPSKSAGPLLLSRHLCPDGKKIRPGESDHPLGRRSGVLSAADGRAHLGTTWADADPAGETHARSPLSDQWHYPGWATVHAGTSRLL